MNAYEKLYENISREMDEFKKSLLGKTVAEVYGTWYKIGFFESFSEMLSSGFLEDQNVDEVVSWLSQEKDPVLFLYDAWLSCDGSLSYTWEDMIDFVRTVYSDVKENESLDAKIEDARNRAVEIASVESPVLGERE